MPVSCPTCFKNVGTKENKLVCSTCNRTYHGNCVNLKDIEYKSESGEGFSCPSCRNTVRKLRSYSCNCGGVSAAEKASMSDPLALIIKKLSKLDKIAEDIELIKNTQTDLCEQIKKCSEQVERNSSLLREHDSAISECQRSITDLHTTNNSVLSEISSLKSKIGEIGNMVVTAKNSVSGVASGSSDAVSSREILERLKRSYNIIIKNIPEGNDADDVEVVKGILNSIDNSACDTVVSVTRIGRASNNRRPVKVCFSNFHTPLKVLKSRRLILDNPALKNYHISDDKSREQVEKLNRTREELKNRLDKGEKHITIKYINGEPSIVSSLGVSSSGSL
ncbi:uncharacterized protein LOC123681986 [Harmonia axyridis]|uniref:uncharacterized protein LOC123681986 n=1 Tax=Harmonia axyridis TaxID=115357 RepID=UPI001E27742F|nr:uncharacterized protein LOC123681986 [Harmonia axyridis]